MSEEEKKAIERLDYFEPNDLVEYAMYRDCVEKIKNLIEKQQKEIEDLKDKIKEILNNTEKNIEEDRPSIVLENLILNIEELLGE